MTARRSSLAIAALAALAALACGVATPARADPVVLALGVDLPLSGVDGAEGTPARNAVVLAVETENRRGFPGGARVIVEDLDDTVSGKHDPAQGALNYKSFVDDPRVVAVIGPMNSNVAEAQIPIARASSLAEISMGASATDLTANAPAPPAFFRVCASNARQGAELARFAARRRLDRIFVVDDNESYGRGLADAFVADVAAHGGRILGREHLPPYALDDRALLTKIAALRPNALFFGGIVSTGGGLLRRQMGDAGLGGVAYLGGDGLASAQYVALAGSAADGTYFSLIAPDVERLPAARDFVRAYRARFGSEPGAYAPGAYAAAIVALEAVRARLRGAPATRPTRADVRASIAATAGVSTPLGLVGFDAHGDVLRPTVSIYRVEHGRARFVSQS